VTLVDDSDYDAMSKFCWHVYETKGRACYACRRVKQPDGSRKTLFMHVAILGEGQEIDHRDRDGLNNTRTNLRRATRQMQTQNRQGGRKSSSKYKGVSYAMVNGVPRPRPWKAQYRKDGQTVHIGYYDTELEAAREYNKVAKKVFEYGLLNEVED